MFNRKKELRKKELERMDEMIHQLHAEVISKLIDDVMTLKSHLSLLKDHLGVEIVEEKAKTVVKLKDEKEGDK